jgi:hypothetical protein
VIVRFLSIKRLEIVPLGVCSLTLELKSAAAPTLKKYSKTITKRMERSIWTKEIAHTEQLKK